VGELTYIILQFRNEDIVNFLLIFVNNALTICGCNLYFLRLFRNAGYRKYLNLFIWTFAVSVTTGVTRRLQKILEGIEHRKE